MKRTRKKHSAALKAKVAVGCHQGRPPLPIPARGFVTVTGLGMKGVRADRVSRCGDGI